MKKELRIWWDDWGIFLLAILPLWILFFWVLGWGFLIFLIISIFTGIIIRNFYQRKKEWKEKYSVFYVELQKSNHPYKAILLQLLENNYKKNSLFSPKFPREICQQKTILAKFFALPIIFYIAIIIAFFVIFIILWEYLKIKNYDLSWFELGRNRESIISVIWWTLFFSFCYFAYIRRKARIEKIFQIYENLQHEWKILYKMILDENISSREKPENVLVFSLLLTKISDNFIAREKNLQKISRICKNSFFKKLYDLEAVKNICDMQKFHLMQDAKKMQKIIINWTKLESEKIANISHQIEERQEYFQQKARLKILQENLEKIII